ncbi:Cobalt uptake substrate-specific transmembrane region [Loktanella salsilacus]|uniref:Cobalt uptake substrate-specific transmembrane region n=1 Tax=Loktanella salsilacus TaxID=195913 RepID=A0A1I4HZ72_9RHOB|nr:energy-coupling factor ABC transporter permease [Loktanella salsilacus]SFL47472.1 Cobalt uptake substrate-specific transmembrane region [Loktanella salsilacus]
MHIEPGVVTGAKLALGSVTAAGAATVSAKMVWENLVQRGAASLIARSAMATAATFVFFELLPHLAVGPSEVHLILGSTLLLMLGTAPAAVGLALGLLLQGLLMSPTDLPQYGMNVTTLLVPLLALHMVTKSVVARGTAYVDLTYTQALKLSTTYQAGVVAWVAFWVVWGEGASVSTLASLSTFGAAYMTVVLIEPLVDLAVLAVAKRMKAQGSGLLDARVYG